MNSSGDTGALVERFPALRKLDPGQSSRRIPYIQQMSATECGAACLAMALALFGKHAPLAEVRQVAGVDRDGATALSILHAARWYGLRARGVKLELEGLPYLDRGAILHWEFSHFVVFDRLRKDGVKIIDPASGHRVVSFDQFNRSFTGVALTLSPAEEFRQTGQQRNVVWSYVRQFLGQTRLWGRIAVVSVLLQLFALGLPLLTGTLVDRIIPRGDAGLLHLLGAGLIGIVVFSALASVLRAQLLLHLRTKLDAKMTLGFLDHLVSLPFGFFQQRSEGDLMMRVSSNATIREMLTSSALSGLLDGALAISYLAILLIANAAMGAIVLSLALLQAAVFLFSYRRYQDLMSQDLQTQAKAQSYLVQMLAGIETLKANGVEERAVEQWSNLFVDGLNVSLSRGRLSATVDSLMGGLKSGSPLLVMWFGGWLAMNGDLSLGTMLALNALAAGFLGPVSTVISTSLQLQLLRSYVERIDDVLAAPPEQDKNEVVPAPALRGEIELRDISFSYSANSSSAGLHGVSVKIEPGQKVAIVGQSGAGKSTLAKLLLGLYRPSSGNILFDGVDLSEYDLRSVRRQCGIVTQRSHLFSGTIRENISLNDPGIPLDAVTEASKLACLHRDVAGMPMGYETVLADGGSSISGGQRQRVALARALVNRPAIVLLDEATSELDSITEAEAHRNLSRLNCTRIVIAHRLSTITDADLILVMDNGKLVEQGTHRKLLESAGHYARLIAAQVEV
jgi:ABC-type bacteriocin/lantibiotic exporter with double-glycine peptidase domain